jgi:hypothetical protein
MHPAHGRDARLRLGAIALLVAVAPIILAACGPREQLPNLETLPQTSIFGDRTPRTVADPDTRPVELGVKFRPSKSGAILGVRFFKSAQNTGPHKGNLWDSKGNLLARADFRSETASGWQKVYFDKPVYVAPNSTYVASYHTTTGHYAADQWFFKTPTTRGPLTALAHGQEGSNSVYAYGGSSRFPTGSWTAANYWVDVLFSDAIQNPVATTTTSRSTPAGAPTTVAETTTTEAPTTTALGPITVPKPPPTAAPAPAKPAPGPVPIGAFPSAANTGTRGALSPSGSLTVTTNGAVIDSKDVTGCIMVKASNVTIKNTRVRFTGGCANEIVRLEGGTNLVVQDSELDGQRNQDCGEAIGYSNYTALRVNMHDCTDGPRVSGKANVTIRDSWIHNLSNLPGDHGDGMQCYQGVGQQTIVHNTIEGGTNAAYMTADDCNGPVLFDRNLIKGGGYAARFYANQVTVTNNVFVNGSWDFGPTHLAGTVQVVTWSNNRTSTDAAGLNLAGAINR